MKKKMSFWVREEAEEKLRKPINKMIALDDPELKDIYEELENNPNIPLDVLASNLRKKLNRNIRASALKNYAIRWQLPFTE